MKTVTQSDLVERAKDMSVDLVNRLLIFNWSHDPDVPPHFDTWKLGGRLQESILTFLARREVVEESETDMTGLASAALEEVNATARDPVREALEGGRAEREVPKFGR